MKIIRPEYTPPKKVEEKPTRAEMLDEMAKLSQEYNLIDEKPIETKRLLEFEDNQLIDDNTSTIEHLMHSVINGGLLKEDSNAVKVEFTLTKRQYELWQKKGAEKWLKKALLGQRLKSTKKR